MPAITYRITLEIEGHLPNYPYPFPCIMPRRRFGKLDQQQAVKQLQEAFATLNEDFADMVREVREARIRAWREARKSE